MFATKLTEASVEMYAIDLLKTESYEYLNGQNIAPDSETPARVSFSEVILGEQLKAAVTRINPTIPLDAIEDAIKQIQRLSSPELIANNESFHRMLTEGIKVNYKRVFLIA